MNTLLTILMIALWLASWLIAFTLGRLNGARTYRKWLDRGIRRAARDFNLDAEDGKGNGGFPCL